MDYLKVNDEATTDNELVIDGYIALFGGKDLTGEHFTPDTVFESSYTAKNTILIDWEHGHEPDDVKDQPGRDDIFGHVDWLTARADDIGILARHVLDRRERYVSQFIEPMARAQLLGSSSEAARKGIVRTKDGHIVKWPLKRQSFTVTPAEPRLLTQHQLQVIKSLENEFPQLKSLIGDQEIAENTGADQQPIINEENDMSEEILKAIQEQLGFLSTELKTVREEAAEMKAVYEKLDNTIATKTTPRVIVVEDETDKAIAENPNKLGLFCQAVKSITKPSGGELSKVHKAILGNNESVPAEGGFLLQTEQVQTLEKKMHDTAVFSSRAAGRSIGGGANAVSFYGVDEDSRATGSRFGGVQGYRVAEGQSITASKPKFYKYTLMPEKYAAVVYATDEILADTGLLQQEILESCPLELAFMLDDDMMNGNAAGYPKGVLNANCLIEVPKETGQSAATVVAQNIIKMWARRWARGDYAWFINQDVTPQLHQLNLPVGTGGALVYMPPGGLSASPYGSLYGRPVIETEFNATLGTVGDIVLADWSQYKLASKGSLTVATSIHVEFLTDQTAFRFTARYDGQPSWKSDLTPYKGTATQSPFIALATRS